MGRQFASIYVTSGRIATRHDRSVAHACTRGGRQPRHAASVQRAELQILINQWGKGAGASCMHAPVYVRKRMATPHGAHMRRGGRQPGRAASIQRAELQT